MIRRRENEAKTAKDQLLHVRSGLIEFSSTAATLLAGCRCARSHSSGRVAFDRIHRRIQRSDKESDGEQKHWKRTKKTKEIKVRCKHQIKSQRSNGD